MAKSRQTPVLGTRHMRLFLVKKSDTEVTLLDADRCTATPNAFKLFLLDAKNRDASHVNLAKGPEIHSRDLRGDPT